MTKFMCLKQIAEHYGLAPDLQELMEQAYHKKCITNLNMDFDEENEGLRDDDYVLYNRFIGHGLRNKRKGLNKLRGSFEKMDKTIEFHISGEYTNGGGDYICSCLMIDGVPLNSFSYDGNYRLMICEHGKGTKHNGKIYWGLTKPEIVKLLKDRNIKFNKSKKKGELIRIMWSK